MSLHRKRAKRLCDQRSNDRTKATQDRLTAMQLAGLRRTRDPAQRHRTRDRARPTCPLCKRAKVYTDYQGTRPICRHCWADLGGPTLKEQDELAAAAERRQADLEQADRPKDAPW